MNNLKKAYYLLRYLGPQIIWLRAGVYLRNGLGVTARTYRPRPWESLDLAELCSPGTPTALETYAAFKRAQNVRFLFPLGAPPAMPAHVLSAAVDREPPLDERLQLLRDSRVVYFFRTVSPEPIDWHVNSLENKRGDASKTWCDLPDFIPEQGDMRMLWEPSRCAWAIDVAKGKSRGLLSDADQLYWRWLDSWMNASPPYLGFQWKCGQESSVRFIALALGFWSIANEPATTPDRWLQFARMAWATGHRVAHHINYALSQKNNHSMSEAVGLMLIATLFPEFRDARAWWSKGREVLEYDLRRQISPDGTYLQSSMNYERVMLQICMLGMRLAELADEPLPRDVYGLLDRCTEFLYQMMEPRNGRLPNYGSNDGAYVLPLSECDFTDFRSALQAAHYLAHRKRLLPAGAWDEDLAWLFGAEAANAVQEPTREPKSSAFTTGDYYTIRRPESWMMTRCHTYRYRAGQCDQLHVDLWWRGLNLLKDCGSYHYYVPGRSDIEFYFKSVQAHNTLELDGQNYVELASRFLWFPWPKGRTRVYEPNGPAGIYEGEHQTYDRAPWGVLHRRAIVSLPDSLWVIIDDILGEGSHRALLRWHLLDAPFTVSPTDASVELATCEGPLHLSATAEGTSFSRFEVIRGRDEPGRFQGFESRYFGEMLPIPTLETEYTGALPVRVATVVSPLRSIRPTLSTHAAGATLSLSDVSYRLQLSPLARAASCIVTRVDGLPSTTT